MSTNKIVILVGPSCSGKTTCYKTLIAAYRRLNMAATDYPKVHKLLVNMSAYSMQQVLSLYYDVVIVTNMFTAVR